MNRPEEIKTRIGNIDQIAGIVGAMRALASSQEHEALRHVAAIREQAATVAEAMATALVILHGQALPAVAAVAGQHLRIVVGAAQGFSGAYNDQIVQAALADTGDSGPDAFIIIGARCLFEMEQRGIVPIWDANMAAHAAEVPQLANRVVDAVFGQMARGETTSVSIIHGEPAGGGVLVRERQLLPIDFARLGRARPAEIPLTMLPPDVLIERLVEEYVFTEICEALMLGFGAENNARLLAMSRAKSNVARIAADLKIAYAQAMQEEITTEIIELSQSDD